MAVKVLTITSLQFRLPDNFSGSITEALHELANYHEMAKDLPRSTQEVLDPAWQKMSYKDVGVFQFDRFIDVIKDGRRLSGLCQLSNYEISDVEALDGSS